MKVVVAIDSFKGSLTSVEAGRAVAEGISHALDAEVIVRPVADGGEGTVEALVEGLGGTLVTTLVTGPLGSLVDATWGIIEVSGMRSAIIEMSSASGIALLSREELNPTETTTYGVGEIILDAIDKGIRNFIIGIGGSSTNDGGVGMLQALGFEFLDSSKKQIARGAKGLESLIDIRFNNVTPELSSCSFKVACDVTNPLCGKLGCSRVFGPQKGATPEQIELMDAWLSNYAKLSGGDKDYPGAGAAGGMGFAFKTFLNASLEPGIGIVLKETRLEDYIKDADIVVTGEGRMDSLTIMGKAPVGVAALARKYDKRVIAFCGCSSDDADVCNEFGIDAYFAVLRNVVSLEEALDKKNAAFNLSQTAKQVFRLLKFAGSSKAPKRLMG